MSMTRPSPTQIEAAGARWRIQGQTRALDFGDVLAVTKAFSAGLIRADVGDRLIANLPGTPLPPSIRATSGPSARPPTSAPVTRIRREFTDHVLQVHGNQHGCPEARFLDVLAELTAGRISEMQAFHRLAQEGAAARAAELAAPSPKLPDRRAEASQADLIVRGYLHGDRAALEQLQAEQPEPPPETAEMSVERFEELLAQMRIDRQARRGGHR